MKQSKTVNKEQKNIKPELSGGFRDYGPQDACNKEWMIGTIRANFKRFGFEPIETPAVERTEILTGGEKDSGKIIFNVKGSEEKKSTTSLRFDLTVPLARFLAMNPEIPKPFKRYQIGNVWRGERSQAGRYREFTQADIDIVGSTSIQSDAEIIGVIYMTLKKLGIDDFVIKINNRKLLNTLCAYANISEKKLWPILRLIDKTDKIGSVAVYKEIEKIFGKSIRLRVKDFFDLETRSNNDNKGSIELVEIENNLALMGIEKSYYQIDKTIIRGLGYYTGSIFETILTKMPEIGSICSGGRYDNLVARFTGQNIPAVGASFGVDRLFVAMKTLGMFENRRNAVDVLIFNLDTSFIQMYYTFAKTLRNIGMNTSLYLGEDRSFSAQLAYAVKKAIPYVVIYGENEKKKNVITIKNLTARTQEEVNINEFEVVVKKMFKA